MKMQMSTEDMLHIVELLREDMLMGEAAMEGHPFNKDIKKSIERSRSALLKISSYALLQAYNTNDDDDDTNEMEERNRLN
tara:strand:- start:1054 stop:1293 length:240 start_codon:yes stop_codon:yes gene_type:complete